MPLHPLDETDLGLILPWRNAPAVREAMYHHHEISPEEHDAWFEGMRRNPSARWYLYSDLVGVSQGVVYFTEFDPGQRTAFWGFYTRPGASPGTGTRMLREGLELAFGELGLRKLNGEALITSVASAKVHRKLGFVQEGVFREQHFDGDRYVDVVRFGLLAREWEGCRE